MFTILALSMNMPSKRLDAISLGIIVFYRMVLATEGKTSSGAWEAFSKSEPVWMQRSMDCCCRSNERVWRNYRPGEESEYK